MGGGNMDGQPTTNMREVSESVENTLQRIQSELGPTYPDGVPAALRIAKLREAYPGYGFELHATDQQTGFSIVDVFLPGGGHLRIKFPRTTP
jgi:hypothetical protein